MECWSNGDEFNPVSLNYIFSTPVLQYSIAPVDIDKAIILSLQSFGIEYLYCLF